MSVQGVDPVDTVVEAAVEAVAEAVVEASPAEAHSTVVDGIDVLGAISPSRAGDFMSCPLLYRFRTVDKLPEPFSIDAVRGTVVHKVLEDLFDLAAADRTPERAHELIVPAWESLLETEPEAAEMFAAMPSGRGNACGVQATGLGVWIDVIVIRRAAPTLIPRATKSIRRFCRHRPAESHPGRNWRGRSPGTRSPRQSPQARPDARPALAPRALAARRPLPPCLRCGSVRD